MPKGIYIRNYEYDKSCNIQLNFIGGNKNE